jgi:two-component system cell cycle sensor histidine kinase/response regulator CckA
MANKLQFEEGKTEKEILELKLRESEKMYRDLFENANDAIFTFDAGGRIIAANNAAVRVSGYNTKDEVIGTQFSDWLTPESFKQAMDNTRKYYLGEHVQQPVIYEFIRKDGEHGWLEVRSRIIKDGDKIIAVHCIARDITEKRKLEQELKESEAKYRELFENGQDVMYVLDMEGNFMNINRIGLQILGCEKEDIIGSNISKWLTPGSLKIALERQRKRLSGDIVNQTDIIELVCKNGEHRWAEIKSRAIRDGGDPIEIHGIARDITENKRLKHELKESNKQLQLLRYLMTGTRGGNTRAQIVNLLTDRPYNANQLSKALNLDYKTVRHHLDVLIKNGIVTKGNDYPVAYFISKNIEENLNEFNRKRQP